MWLESRMQTRRRFISAIFAACAAIPFFSRKAKGPFARLEEFRAKVGGKLIHQSESFGRWLGIGISFVHNGAPVRSAVLICSAWPSDQKERVVSEWVDAMERGLYLIPSPEVLRGREANLRYADALGFVPSEERRRIFESHPILADIHAKLGVSRT